MERRARFGACPRPSARAFVYSSAPGQLHAYALRLDAGARRSRPRRPVRDGDAHRRLERARRRHRGGPSRRCRLSRRPSRTDTRAARRHRPGPGHRRHHLGMGAVAIAPGAGGGPGGSSAAFQAMVGPGHDWRRVSWPDGSADGVRHAAAQPVRLDLVRARLDADRRRVSLDRAECGADCRLGHRRSAPSGAHRARAAGTRLHRSRGPARAGARVRRDVRRLRGTRPVRDGANLRRTPIGDRRAARGSRLVRRGRGPPDILLAIHLAHRPTAAGRLRAQRP
jgi:hypothetical protein